MISRSRFIRNRTTAVCGGVECTATARGGGIFIGGMGAVQITSSEVRENRGHSRGDGGSLGDLTRSFGAGVYVNGATVALTNNVISCNVTSGESRNSFAGAGLYVNQGTVSVENSTIARNATATGAAHGGGALDILNSIIFFNNGNGEQLSGTVTVNFSDVQNRTPGESEMGNLTENPAFAGAGCGQADHRIVVGSAAIDAGNPSSEYDDACSPPSLGDASNDMGAFGGPQACEWQ